MLSLLSTVIFFFFIIVDKFSQIQLDFSQEGFTFFFDLFDFPVKLLTAGAVLFGLWLTIERMKQTEKQIDSIVSNNRFNNFYKHKEEFVNFMLNRQVFTQFPSNKHANIKNYTVMIYNLAYSTNPEEFSGKIKKEFKNKGIRTLAEIGSYFSNKEQLRHLDIKEIDLFLNKIHFAPFGELNSLIDERLDESIPILISAHIDSFDPDKFEAIYKILKKLSFFADFFNSMLAFSGEPVYMYDRFDYLRGKIDLMIVDYENHSEVW